MTETDHLSQMRSMSQGEGSPGRPPGRPMRQLEFNQAMSDFRHMFPETDEEVIEAVLRANNGMVDATIDQLLTMNIDSEVNEDDDLPDHILMSVERDVQQQQLQQQTQHHQSHQVSRRSSREARAAKKALQADSTEKYQSKESEDCPPSYTEAVQSHLSHHHRSSNSRNRHRNSPTTGINNGSSGHHTRHSLGTMQHLLDLGPETAPVVSSAGVGHAGPTGATSKVHHSHHHSSHHHHSNHHHYNSRSSNHHRRRGDALDGSPSKSRPGRNLLAAAAHHDLVAEELSFHPQRKGSLDSSDFNCDGGAGVAREKSPQRWRSSHRESTSVKRPAYRNWNPPLLGTLPDDFLRITTHSATPGRPGRQQLHRAMSAVGPERPQFYPKSSTPSSFHAVEPSPSQMGGIHSRPRPSSHKPQRSLSFAGNTNHPRRQPNMHPSGLVQHEFSSDILQERMKENERRRRMTSMDLDPDMAQYLEDERLAIILQNSEFLQELRGDRTFMMTLERDQKHTDADKTKQESLPDPITPPAGLDGDDQDFIEGYGDDRRDTLEAFPFSQQLPPPVSEDVELRKKLKNMGKASRKQFAALARKFFLKRRKKTAQQILKESQAPSMMNLLGDDEDESDEGDEINNGESNSVSEPCNIVTNTQSTTSTSWSTSQSKQHFDVM